MRWTFVDCSRVMQQFAFISFCISPAFERRANDNCILFTVSGSGQTSMVAGKVPRCWQHMSSVLEAVWVNLFIFQIIQVISSGSQPAGVSAAWQPPCASTQYTLFLIPWLQIGQPNSAIRCTLLFWSNYFERRNVRLWLLDTNECHCAVAVSKPTPLYSKCALIQKEGAEEVVV